MVDSKIKKEVVNDKKPEDALKRDTKAPFTHGDHINDIKEKILNDHKPGMVLFLKKGDTNNEDYLKVLKYLAKESNEYLNVMAYTVNTKDKDDPIRKEINIRNLPIFKSYKNGVTGKAKSEGAHDVAWGANVRNFDIDSKTFAENILKEVIEGIEDDMTEQNADHFFKASHETKHNNKVFVSYLYKGKSSEIDPSFRVITLDPRIKDKFGFFAMNDPAPHILGEGGAEGLPYIQGSYLDSPDTENGEYEVWRISEDAKNKQGKFRYNLLMMELLRHYPELQEAFAEEIGMKEPAKADEVSKTMSTVPHKFREIQS